MLVYPGFKSTRQPRLVNLGEPSSLLDFWMAAESFRLKSKSFRKLLPGCSVMVGMSVPEMEKQKWSTTFLFFSNMDFDLEGLKLILAQVMSPSRIHLLPGTNVVVMVRSSISSLIGAVVCLTWLRTLYVPPRLT